MIGVRMASYPGAPRQAVVVAIIDFTIMSRAPPCERRVSVGTRGREIPAKRGVQDGVGWPGAPVCFRASGPVVDPLLVSMVVAARAADLMYVWWCVGATPVLSTDFTIRWALAGRQHRDEHQMFLTPGRAAPSPWKRVRLASR